MLKCRIFNVASRPAMDVNFALEGRRLEAAWFGPPPAAAPTLVLLHEGLGCLSLWRGLPEQLARETGCGVLAYSRFGYGGSASVTLPRPLDYMHEEARTLGRVLDHFGVADALLVGHSDGASIAAIGAGAALDARLRGLVLLAPHFFVEPCCIAAIEAAVRAFETGDLRAKLARWHGANTEAAFRGWAGAWLDPSFPQAFHLGAEIAAIRAPMLIVQGDVDPYGTMAQAAFCLREAAGSVDVLALSGCGHAPQVDMPEATRRAIIDFARRVLAG